MLQIYHSNLSVNWENYFTGQSVKQIGTSSTLKTKASLQNQIKIFSLEKSKKAACPEVKYTTVLSYLDNKLTTTERHTKKGNDNFFRCSSTSFLQAIPHFQYKKSFNYTLTKTRTRAGVVNIFCSVDP